MLFQSAELQAQIQTEGPKYRQAFMNGDPDHTGVWFGEAAGTIHAIESAADIVQRLSAEAWQRLSTYPTR